MTVTIQISAGELIDRLSILEIKMSKIKDTQKLLHVSHEHNTTNLAFKSLYDGLQEERQPTISELAIKVKEINSLIWDVEDGIRDHERRADFGPSFIELARKVYHYNDERAALKRQINELLGSEIIEEKSYTDYKSCQ